MLQRLSIKARVTLFATAILIAAVLLLAIFSGRLLRADTERLIGEQQLSMIKLIAAQVDERVQDRTRALASVAAGGIAEIMSDPQRLQARLEQREVLTRLFNRGGFVVDRTGIVIASVPIDLGRVGIKYGDGDAFRAIMAGQKSFVSKPLIGKPNGTPVFGMAVPIASPRGEIMGVLYGATDLGAPNFLDIVTANRLGENGGYFVIDPQSRLILSARDKSRLMEQLPKPGVNPALDAFAASDASSAKLVNAKGVEVLSSIKSIPAAGWQLVASIPLAELDEPIVATRAKLVFAALLLVVLAAGIMWRTVRRELAPVQDAAKQLDGTVDGGARPLVVTRPDEIGELFEAVNRQLAALKAREDALAQTSRLARIGGWEMYPATDTRIWSTETLRMLEIDPPVSPATTEEVRRYYPPEALPQMVAAHRAAIETGAGWDFEVPMLTATGRRIWTRNQGVAEQVDGVTVKLLGTMHDITERKEAELQLAAQRDFDHQVITSMGQGLSVTDASGAFQLVNPALASLLGYPAQELIGKQSNDYVDVEDQAINMRNRQARREGRTSRYLVRLVRADGSRVNVAISGWPRYTDGIYLGAITVITDLTETDRLQAEVREQRDFANYVLNAMGQGLTIIGADGRFEFCNAAYAALVGREVKDILGKTPDDVSDPDDRAMQVDQHNKRRAGLTSTYEVRFRRPDGSFVYAAITGTPRFKDGKYSGSIAVITDLTERKRIEAELAQQRDFAESILSNMGQGVAVTDAEGRFEYINPAYGKLLGWDPQELVGKTVDDITHPDDMKVSLAQRELRRTGVASTYPIRLVRRDGIAVSVSGTASPRVVEGRFCGAIAVVTDLTERNAMEQELKDQRDFAESVISSMGKGVAVSDSDGKLVYVNQFYAALLGYEASDVVGHHVEEFLPETDRATLSNQLAKRRQGMSSTYESRRLRSDGQILDVLITASPRYVRGENVGSIAVLTDLTEQRAAERALVESDLRFRSLMEDVSSIAVQGYAMDGTVVFWNRASEQLYGYSAAEAMGKSLLELIIPAEMSAGVEAAIAHMARTGEVEPAGKLTLQRKDGSTVSVYSTHALSKRNGRVHELFCLDIDLTEQDRAAATREALEERLRQSQKMEAIGTLAGGIAHDFNNILATILGNVELARHSTFNDSQVSSNLDEIRKAGTRARDLVGQILSFSRRQPTARKPLLLGPIVREAVRLVRAALPVNISLDFETAPSTAAVLGDSTQLQQVVINLATNAIHAIGDEAGQIRIRLDSVMSDAMSDVLPEHVLVLAAGQAIPLVRLRVTDTGHGMEEATISRLFEPFFTTKAVDEGTGLGLSVVHGIVQSHDGVIRVESLPGAGATFTILLPAAEASAMHEQPESDKVTVAEVPLVARAKRVLYLDDDEALALLVTRMLERRGYKVIAFTDQRAAIDALRAHPDDYSLFVTDYNMPGMSGLDVAREVRAVRPDLPVAVVSGFVDEKLRALAAEAGVKELIFKANVVEDFCDAVQRLVLLH